MIRILMLAMFMAPAGAFAECKSRTVEPFGKFIESFGWDKDFAVMRTEYPLRVIRHEEVDLTQGGRVPVLTLLAKEDDAATPAIAVFARDNDVELNTTLLRKAEATVRMAKPSTDSLIVDYHFVRKGACWYLRRLEDHTL